MGFVHSIQSNMLEWWHLEIPLNSIAMWHQVGRQLKAVVSSCVLQQTIQSHPDSLPSAVSSAWKNGPIILHVLHVVKGYKRLHHICCFVQEKCIWMPMLTSSSVFYTNVGCICYIPLPSMYLYTLHINLLNCHHCAQYLLYLWTSAFTRDGSWLCHQCVRLLFLKTVPAQGNHCLRQPFQNVTTKIYTSHLVIQFN